VPDDVQVTADGVLVSYHHVADPDALVSSATG
jgi:glycerophosphoryl diester phosphodiesterase